MSVHNTIYAPASNNYFPGRMVRKTMGYKSNIKELEALKRAAPKENKGMIQTLLELYRDRKIPQFVTVERAVNRLSLRTKNKAVQAKALKDFEALTKKYMDALPATGRIERSIAEKRLRTGGKLSSITLILFRRAAAGDAEATVSVANGDGKGQGQVGQACS